MTQTSATQAAGKTTIRPFQVNVPEAELTELRRRINSTRWPDRETVTDESQGVPLATIQELAHNWATRYDRRKREAKLNVLPQFITTIGSADAQSSKTNTERGKLGYSKNYRDKFSGKYSHRELNGIGHNVPQEAPQAFAQAIINVDGYSRG